MASLMYMYMNGFCKTPYFEAAAAHPHPEFMEETPSPDLPGYLRKRPFDPSTLFCAWRILTSALLFIETMGVKI
jgi:hypothetical protein